MLLWPPYIQNTPPQPPAIYTNEHSGFSGNTGTHNILTSYNFLFKTPNDIFKVWYTFPGFLFKPLRIRETLI